VTQSRRIDVKRFLTAPALAAAVLTAGVGATAATGQDTAAKPVAKTSKLAGFDADRAATATRADRSFRGPLTLTPVAKYTITATFGQAGGRWARNHTGLDFAAPTGTPVRAVAAGTVIKSGWAGAYGNQLRIRHADGTESWYNHMSRYAVKTGSVKAGQVIGYVGSTGNTTGPHLHLEIRKAGSPVNPMTWLRAKGVRV